MSGCQLCPRGCGVERPLSVSDGGPFGVCGVGRLPVVARAAPHFGEEPCISGTRGAGTVFFSGCTLQCIYCQNHEISTGRFGREVTVERLREIFDSLIAQGVHNLDLVTPMHFTPAVLEALERPISVPVIVNTGGYENVTTLRRPSTSDGTNEEPRIENLALPELENLLQQAIDSENYEEAARISEIIKCKKSQ